MREAALLVGALLTMPGKTTRTRTDTACSVQKNDKNQKSVYMLLHKEVHAYNSVYTLQSHMQAAPIYSFLSFLAVLGDDALREVHAVGPHHAAEVGGPLPQH